MRRGEVLLVPDMSWGPGIQPYNWGPRQRVVCMLNILLHLTNELLIQLYSWKHLSPIDSPDKITISSKAESSKTEAKIDVSDTPNEANVALRRLRTGMRPNSCASCLVML